MRQRQPELYTRSLDLVALSLAVWLGLVVGGLGLQRLTPQAVLEAVNQGAAAELAVSDLLASGS